jgi:TRAP transporter TAXI family solute receptor
MEMFKGAIKTLAAGLAAATMFGTSAQAADAVTLGTSGSGSPFYVNAVGMSRVIQNHAGINVSVESVGGSHPNVFAIANGKIDLAIVNALSALDGFNGKKPFPQKVNLRLIAQGDESLRQVFVRRAAGIEKPSDLEGKKWVSKIPANPDIGEISEALMTAAKINSGKVRQISASATSEIVSGFESGTIDAATMPASARAPHVMRLFDNRLIDYLAITSEQAKAMAPMLPEGLRVRTLAAGTYPHQDKDATVFAVRTILVAGADTPDDVVYRVAKALFENGEELSKFHPTAKHWTVANTVDEAPLPLHPGVVRYLKEKNAWSKELETQQGRF